MTSKIVVNNIEPDSGISSVTFTSNITGEDSTQNISGINSVTASDVIVTNVSASSSVTAATFYGSGANLTGIDASSIKNGSDVKVQANASGAVVTGILTANSFIGISSVTITNGTSSLNKHSVGIGTTDTAGRNAGVGTAVGTLVYNSQTKEVQVYSAEDAWVAVYEEPFVATGGTKSTSGSKTIHTFTSPGTFSVTSGSNTNLEYLVVAGGGGAGGGGGGAEDDGPRGGYSV